MNNREYLDLHGYVAKSAVYSADINIYDKNTGEIKAVLNGDEILKNNTMELTRELINKKLGL